MSNEAEKILYKFIRRLQQNARIRKGLAVLLLAVLLVAIVYFVYTIIPRQYSLSITGGDILSNRHFLAKTLQTEAREHGLSLKVTPTSGSQEALADVNSGKLDMAFVQGGLDNNYPNVQQVATIAPELLHFLVHPDIKDVGDLRGKMINLGSKEGGTRVIAKQVLEFSGLTEGIDYVESNFSSEKLLTLHTSRLPDCIVLISYAPSPTADFLVKERGYKLLEIPFPASLALRLGWVADSQILGYMYKVSPPVPDRDIKTIGVNLHLVANKDVPPRAVFKALESLYSPGMAVALKMKLVESDLTIPSGFALSEGSEMFLSRNDPLFSSEMADNLQALFGLALSLASAFLVVLKWFKGDPIQPEDPPTQDDDFMQYLRGVFAIESKLSKLVLARHLTLDAVYVLQGELSAIRVRALNQLKNANFDNPQLPQHLFTTISDVSARLIAATPPDAA